MVYDQALQMATRADVDEDNTTIRRRILNSLQPGRMMVFVHDLQQTGDAEALVSSMQLCRMSALSRFLEKCSGLVVHYSSASLRATHLRANVLCGAKYFYVANQISRDIEDCYGTDVQAWRSSARSSLIWRATARASWPSVCSIAA